MNIMLLSDVLHYKNTDLLNYKNAVILITFTIIKRIYTV